ncbi:SAC3/GANP/Nin1/mts3/eIF-3 p25 family-domain-containing protein [Lentinula raphanica]|uniref:SAC3/GANP/Nin1/mts3/eIF-3 p25 family-domain-containing protein n=1 Tax=Lentinula raphanica TaxID=153919 RepID=A0AA38P0J5_9AGAR|nr:SAC3/GANP/Nin1/mts3/eIF-3 p25 family-domain-containing protein [Lentinula raphanica]KAJ3834067.1 SAC3/GANP/Nin1/mts3/eIF-3 p25 family-domain-containing protein [Lentinula raphanica]KAJ3972207.1 SAC3/GANP/Nin1/mts3/eIF-3 p25 family-domain-containing protein [Lentinula raphanica]
MASTSWPPQLKDWVAKCLGQMTDSNRKEAQDELRQVIADAFAAHTLWTTDWNGVQLQSLLPKPAPALKRKMNDATPANKKAKKSSVKQITTGTASLDLNDQAALSRRAERFQREHEIERQKSRNSSLKANAHNKHLFSNTSWSTSRSASPSGVDEPEADPNVIDWDRFTIVGTSKEIFKDYLRLTDTPKPETIRPYPVLQETLVQLKKRWREKCSYAWICNQLKSLRQDLIVQRIKNEFTVQVYEIHARMALESSDMVEYNSCQAMLKTLYELGIPGKVEEFTGYRILMLLHGRNRSELNLYVGQLTPKQKADPAVRHALDVQRSLSMGNYHALFLLYLNAPNMGAYIMDHFIPRERVKALMIITKAYRTISLSFLQNELAFDDLDSTLKYLEEHKAARFTNSGSSNSEKIIDCKSAAINLGQVFEEKYRKVGIRGAV